MPQNKNKRVVLILAIFFCLVFSARSLATVANVAVEPELDIARFEPYKITADVSGSPTSASVEISSINGDDPGSAWDFYADGTPASQSRTKTMTYNSGTGKWESQNIYPDDIYPEIFFAPSDITWGNIPSAINLRRNNYHILHFENPFAIVGNMNFFVEINAEPVSLTNSADLSVYLVESGKTADFFNSDWRNSSDVELIGTINRQTAFHHTHVAGKSAHHLIPLTANANATFGSKELDINGDFWLILYANSPNVNRGWNLKYHNSSICDNTNNWYLGNQAGWQTTPQSGCPDSHIHIARRGANSDGLEAVVTANYAESDPSVETREFFFEPLPNLPPNSTNFTSPIAGGNYGENFNIAWNASSDPNDDPVTYTIHLLDSDGNQIEPALVSDTSETSFVWDVSAIENGSYGLKGEVCDNSDLCSDFYLDSNFYIFKSEPIYSISEISIASDNGTDDSLAREGDLVQISFTSSSENLENPSVQIYSGGYAVQNPVTISNVATSWTASYVVSRSDEAGAVSFVVTADNLDQPYQETTNDSYVMVDFEESVEEVEEEEEVSESSQKAQIVSWKARRYEDLNSNLCHDKVRLEIKGKNFDKDVEVRVGGKKPFDIDRKSSKKIIANFCYDKFFQNKTSFKKEIRITNPGDKSVEADKKYDPRTTKDLFGEEQLLTNNTRGIMNIQKALIQLRYLNSQYATGFYGPITTEAVKKFQADNGIEQIGVVGPQTRAKLVEKIK